MKDHEYFALSVLKQEIEKLKIELEDRDLIIANLKTEIEFKEGRIIYLESSMESTAYE